MDYYDEVVEAVFDQHWRDIIMPDGEWDLEQVKKELYDYTQFMEETSKVYDHITMGRFSKVNTSAEVIIEDVDNAINEFIREAIEESV